MYKIGVIGDSDSIMGFSALGLDIYPVTSTEAADERLRTLADGDYGIIYITEDYIEKLGDTVAQLDERMTPAVIPIPSNKGTTGYGRARLKQYVEKAVGSDIIFNEEEQ